MRLSFKQKHSRHDLLPTTTPGKMHRVAIDSVYCVCRLHEGIRQPLEELDYGSSDTIAITKRVKQGCVLAPTLFPLYFCQQCLKRISETWGMEFTLNHARMQTSYSCNTRAKTKTTNILVRELLFADDSALIAHSAEDC